LDVAVEESETDGNREVKVGLKLRRPIELELRIGVRIGVGIGARAGVRDETEDKTGLSAGCV
jgi:hypothetical protein